MSPLPTLFVNEVATAAVVPGLGTNTSENRTGPAITYVWLLREAGFSM